MMIQEVTDRAVREKPPPPAPLTLPLLTQADTHLAPTQTNFVQMVSDNLGNLGTSTDGFDDLFTPAASAIDADSATVGDLVTHVADADFVTGDFNAGNTDSIAQDITDFNATGDIISGTLGGVVVLPPPPDPTPVDISLPPGTGGGGALDKTDPLAGFNSIWMDWGDFFSG